MSLTLDIARRAAGVTWGDLPAAAQNAARLCTADALAVSLGALKLEPAAALFGDHARAGGSGAATILSGGTAPAAAAALANGALGHAVDFEDTYDKAPVHANASVVPAVLALAEAEGKTLGEALTAIALGGDLGCRLSLALAKDPTPRGWYFPPMLTALGAALAAAHLLRLTPEQTVAAMSLTFTQFALTDSLKDSATSHLRAVRDGLAARAAVDSVQLARRGVVATDDVLSERAGFFHMVTGEGPRREPFEDFGRTFLGEEISLKLFPSCRGTHHGIAGALEMRADGITPDQIAAIEFTDIPLCDMLFVPRAERVMPKTAINAKFSIPYCFATALAHGTPGLASFDEAARTDPVTLALAEKITSRHSAPDATPTAHVTLTSGETFDQVMPPAPVVMAGTSGFSDVADKFAGCVAASGLGPRALDAIMALETRPADVSVREVMAAFAELE